MTSPSPLLYNTYDHMYNRGVNGENIFVEERNYDLFLIERDLITTHRQFWNVIAYIHQNPQQHRFVKDFRD